MRCLILLLAICSGLTCKSQIQVSFHTHWNDQIKIIGNSDKTINAGKPTQIKKVKFYVSNVMLLNKQEVVFRDEAKAHLIDLTNPKSFDFSLPLQPNQVFDQIQFTLGIDSITNSSGVYGGDLDPTTGMYWSWQSGFVNFKIEGTHPDCRTRKNEFTFHLGGYLPPYYNAQILTLAAANSDAIDIGLNLAHFFDHIEIAEQNAVMSPSKEAIELMKLLAESFSTNE